MSPVAIELPYPPSVNTYWRRVGAKTIISKKGRQYREAVGGIVKAAGANVKLTEKLSVKIDMYPPDARRRDIDNILKALLDGLDNADVYCDDSQIHHLEVWKRDPIRPNGLVYVEIEELPSEAEILSAGCG